MLYKYCIIIISPLASYSNADLSDARVFSFFTRAPISELANAWMAIMVRLVAVPRQFLTAATKVPPSSPQSWGEGKIHIFEVRI